MAIENKTTKQLLLICCNKLQHTAIQKTIDLNFSQTKIMGIFEKTDDKEYSIVWNCKMCSRYILKVDLVKRHIKSCEKREKTNTKQLLIKCKKLHPRELQTSYNQNCFCPETMVIIENTDDKEYSFFWNCKMCSRYFLSENSVKHHVMSCANELLIKEHLLLKTKICEYNKSKATKRKNNTTIHSTFSYSINLYKKYRQRLIL